MLDWNLALRQLTRDIALFWAINLGWLFAGLFIGLGVGVLIGG